MKVTVNKNALDRALHNALLFAVKDPSRPTLEMVRITAKKNSLTFEATDSYGILREKVGADTGIRKDSLVVFVHRDGALEIRARLKFHDEDDVELEMSAKDGRYHLGLDECRDYGWFEEVRYPDLSKVWSTNEGVTQQQGDVALGPWFFERLGKVKLDVKRGDRSTNPIILRYGESQLKPAYFTFHGTQIEGVVMPVRVQKEETK